MKILIVDDIEDNLVLLEFVLRDGGYEVASAMNGVEALEKLNKDSFDIIISDILMPIMDGFRLCRECKSNDTLKTIPFIFYTATYTEQEDEEFALNLGAVRFIMKPMEPESLIEIIDSVMKDNKNGLQPSPEAPAETGEIEYMKEYNERLVRKLESKMLSVEKANTTLRRQRHDLNERVKELKCLYGIIMSIRERDAIEEIFSDAITLIPPGWQYPEITRARIVFDGVEYSSESFEETEWKQMSDIMVEGDKRGTVEVYYIELCPELDEGPFLKEERNLIDTIARNLSEMVELKRMEKELNKEHALLLQTNKELEKSFRQEAQLRGTIVRAEKLASLGEMAAKIAHEINNPLTVIMGHSQIQMDKVKDPELRESLQKIYSQAEEASHLTRRYMDLGKPVDTKMEGISLSDVLKKSVSTLSAMGHLKLMKISENYLDNGNDIFGNTSMLEQVFRNLIMNAIHASSESLKKEISVGTRITDQGNKIEAFISDKGIGIPSEDLDKIFEEYFTSKEEGVGTGLGLAICKEIVENMHGGNILIESKQGKGTTFKVIIPKLEFSIQKKKILIVDDDAYIGDLFSEYLSTKGFLVQTCLSGKEGLRLFSDFEPDLVLSDYEMPEMNGLEFFKAIKEINPRQAFVMITGAFIPPEELNLLREKRIPQIIKPAELENELLKIVNEQLEKNLE